MVRKIKVANVMLFLTFVVFSIISFFFIYLDSNVPYYYSYLCLLPLSFSLFCILFIRIFSISLSNIAVWFTLLLYFVRNCITPFIMRLGNYAGLFLNVEININKSIALMIYETLVIFIAIYIGCFIDLKYKGRKETLEE